MKSLFEGIIAIIKIIIISGPGAGGRRGGGFRGQVPP